MAVLPGTKLTEKRNLSASSSSRPRTPPSSSSHKMRNADSTPPVKPGPNSPPFKSYINFLSNTNDDWKADEDEMMGYDDDDGDDFGLPSLSNMKRRTQRRTTQNNSIGGGLSPLGETSFGGIQRRNSNSADIAVERPASSYPMPKKTEGKILRPQYKDILKGIVKQTSIRTFPNKLQTLRMPFISSTTPPYPPMPHRRRQTPSTPESHASTNSKSFSKHLQYHWRN